MPCHGGTYGAWFTTTGDSANARLFTSDDKDYYIDFSDTENPTTCASGKVPVLTYSCDGCDLTAGEGTIGAILYATLEHSFDKDAKDANSDPIWTLVEATCEHGDYYVGVCPGCHEEVVYVYDDSDSGYKGVQDHEFVEFYLFVTYDPETGEATYSTAYYLTPDDIPELTDTDTTTYTVTIYVGFEYTYEYGYTYATGEADGETGEALTATAAAADGETLVLPTHTADAYLVFYWYYGSEEYAKKNADGTLDMSGYDAYATSAVRDSTWSPRRCTCMTTRIPSRK